MAPKVYNRQVFSHMDYGLIEKQYPIYINGKQLVESNLERDLGISSKWKNKVITATNRDLFDYKLMRSI